MSRGPHSAASEWNACLLTGEWNAHSVGSLPETSLPLATLPATSPPLATRKQKTPSGIATSSAQPQALQRLVPVARPTTDTNRFLSCYDAAGTSVTFNSRARVRSPAERIFSGERIR
jgi:hypothetical protein